MTMNTFIIREIVGYVYTIFMSHYQPIYRTRMQNSSIHAYRLHNICHVGSIINAAITKVKDKI